ncbi:MAG: hypothetical protein L0K27_13080, partial [Corynebacterium nuruki]|nr:hypothetical protein [Corynebacterium nuruki]
RVVSVSHRTPGAGRGIIMTAAHDNRADQATPPGVGADLDGREDRTATDAEFWAAFTREKEAWKETERRLRDR